jgi:hypothetical protein
MGHAQMEDRAEQINMSPTTDAIHATVCVHQALVAPAMGRINALHA